MKKPRQYSLIRVVPEYKEEMKKSWKPDFVLLKSDVFVFLGEIPNMKGHCIVAAHPNGPIVSGWHIENFEEVPEDET